MIREDSYYNRRDAAPTSLTAGGLAAQSVNILFKDAPSFAAPRARLDGFVTNSLEACELAFPDGRRSVIHSRRFHSISSHLVVPMLGSC